MSKSLTKRALEKAIVTKPSSSPKRKDSSYKGENGETQDLRDNIGVDRDGFNGLSKHWG
jgi:hypothetical protein